MNSTCGVCGERLAVGMGHACYRDGDRGRVLVEKRSATEMNVRRLREYAAGRISLCEPLRRSVMATVRSAATQEIETLRAVLAILNGKDPTDAGGAE